MELQQFQDMAGKACPKCGFVPEQWKKEWIP
jgi:hypothetical protein